MEEFAGAAERRRAIEAGEIRGLGRGAEFRIFLADPAQHDAVAIASGHALRSAAKPGAIPFEFMIGLVKLVGTQAEQRIAFPVGLLFG